MLGKLTPLTHLDPKTFQELLDVNITANWRLIRSLDPLLRASDAGRAVFVSSGAARKHTPFWGGYAMSKAALEMLALTYAAECEVTNVKCNLFNPGTAAHEDARQGVSRRGSGVAGAAGSGGAGAARTAVAGLHEERRARQSSPGSVSGRVLCLTRLSQRPTPTITTLNTSRARIVSIMIVRPQLVRSRWTNRRP